jgi:hypothetical protein
MGDGAGIFPKFYQKIYDLGLARSRVARFFLVNDTKTEKNVPKEHKMHLMVVEYTKCP